MRPSGSDALRMQRYSEPGSEFLHRQVEGSTGGTGGTRRRVASDAGDGMPSRCAGLAAVRYNRTSLERSLFYSGNEAIANGAVRAGAGFACGYPGTPSTEILETAARIDGIHAEWCVNEKVALETAVGASLAGARALVTMKHVGLNVAADPFMTLSLTGVNAGLVVVSADDPGMHSSQNEQDNRNFARFAKVPMLEPSDSQEAYDFMADAFALSEEFDTPVLLRTTTRISHGRGRVVPRVPVKPEARDYARDIAKYVMVPQYARERNRLVLQRLQSLRERAERCSLNVLEAGTADFGIIASGAAYTYAREAFPAAWFLKLGMSYPLPYEQGRASCTSRCRAWPSSRSWTRSSRTRSGPSACPSSASRPSRPTASWTRTWSSRRSSRSWRAGPRRAAA